MCARSATRSSRVSSASWTPPVASSASARSSPSPPQAEARLALRDRLTAALARAEEVERALANPGALRDQSQFAELGREHSRLTPVVEMAAQLQKCENELEQVRELVSVDDPEMAAEAKAEQARLERTTGERERA